MSHKPDNPKGDEAGKDAGDAVAAGHHDAVPEHVVGEVVVAGQCDHPAPGHAQREEDLDTRVSPNLVIGDTIIISNEYILRTFVRHRNTYLTLIDQYQIYYCNTNCLLKIRLEKNGLKKSKTLS